MTPTRPASPGELTVPVTLGIPPLPPPPADLAAMLIHFLEARRDEKLSRRAETVSP